MQTDGSGGVIVHAIQLAIAPVFLFVEEFFRTDLKWLAGLLFIAVMIALIGGLSCFLREVYLATHTGRIEMAKFERPPPPKSDPP